jgi:hypothetical protein
MLSMRWNRFTVCSACDEISSPYAQCAIKFVPRMLSMDCTCKNVHILPLAEHARKFVPRMLSMRWNWFRVCSACDKIVSAYAQKSLIKMQISPIKNQNFEKTSKNLSDRTEVKILVPRMLSHRGNVRTSKFWRKSKEKKQKIFRKFTKGS